MSSKEHSFAVNSYNQAVLTIISCHKKNILPIIFIKYFMIRGFGPDWLKEFRNLLKKQFSKIKEGILMTPAILPRRSGE